MHSCSIKYPLSIVPKIYYETKYILSQSNAVHRAITPNFLILISLPHQRLLHPGGLLHQYFQIWKLYSFLSFSRASDVTTCLTYISIALISQPTSVSASIKCLQHARSTFGDPRHSVTFPAVTFLNEKRSFKLFAGTAETERRSNFETPSAVYLRSRILQD
jgi:hypothetical protein